MPEVFNLTREFKTTVEPTASVRAVATMFGIGLDESITVELYRDLEVKLGKGRIIFATGESGAGKSCLLRDLTSLVNESKKFEAVTEDGREWMESPLLDQFGDMGVKAVMELLNFVGISEAFVYLRKPRELSDGQRYRFLLAKLIRRAQGVPKGRQPVIFVDEFLALLDRETALNVAYQVRRVATKFGMCFVVATTHTDIRRELQPNLTITMRLNMPPELIHNEKVSET